MGIEGTTEAKPLEDELFPRVEKEVGLLRRLATIVHSDESLDSGGELLLDRLLDRMVTEIAVALDAEAVSIYLAEDQDQPDQYVLRATFGLEKASIRATKLLPGEGLGGTAAIERRIIAVENASSDPRYAYKPETGEETFHGLIAAPIMRNSVPVGVLVIQFIGPRAFHRTEKRLIGALAEQVSFALKSAFLYTALRNRAEEMERLYQVTQKIGTTLNLEQVLGEIVRESMRIIPSRGAVLRLLQTDQHHFAVAITAGRSDFEGAALEPLEYGEGPAGLVVWNRRAINLPRGSSVLEESGYGKDACLIAVPLLKNDRVVGTLELVDKASGNRAEYSEADVRVLSILAHSASEALHKAELFAEIESVALGYRRRNRGLTILDQLAREMLATSSLEEIMAIALTGVTSGFGLGFNRALILLIDPAMNRLQGEFGIGPSPVEVGKVWEDISSRYVNLEEHFENIDCQLLEATPFNQLVTGIRLSIVDSRSQIERCIREKRSTLILDAERSGGIDAELGRSIGARRFAIVPILTREIVIGVMIVDNLFTNRYIQEEDLVMLQTIANQCGLALDNSKMISELSEAMSKLEHTTTKLIEAERLATIGEMAAGVAHDIRNPLTAIGGFTRRIVRRLPEDDPGREYGRIIEKEVGRLEKLAREVLELASARPKKKKNVEPLELVKTWLETNQLLLIDKKLSISTEGEDVHCRADPLLLGQAISNVLLNAVQSSSYGGGIRCTVEEAGESVVIRIRDFGKGMEEDVCRQAFEPFFSTTTEGTGLGLALAKKAIAVHGGEITLDSTPGAGTTIEMKLPK